MSNVRRILVVMLAVIGLAALYSGHADAFEKGLSIAFVAFVGWWLYRIGFEDGRKQELEREYRELTAKVNRPM